MNALFQCDQCKEGFCATPDSFDIVEVQDFLDGQPVGEAQAEAVCFCESCQSDLFGDDDEGEEWKENDDRG